MIAPSIRHESLGPWLVSVQTESHAQPDGRVIFRQAQVHSLLPTRDKVPALLKEHERRLARRLQEQQ